jgi:hypothetical protein
MIPPLAPAIEAPAPALPAAGDLEASAHHAVVADLPRHLLLTRPQQVQRDPRPPQLTMHCRPARSP